MFFRKNAQLSYQNCIFWPLFLQNLPKFRCFVWFFLIFACARAAPPAVGRSADSVENTVESMFYSAFPA